MKNLLHTVIFEREDYMEVVTHESNGTRYDALFPGTVSRYTRIVECSKNGIIQLYRIEWIDSHKGVWQHVVAYSRQHAKELYYNHVTRSTLIGFMHDQIAEFQRTTRDGFTGSAEDVCIEMEILARAIVASCDYE